MLKRALLAALLLVACNGSAIDSDAEDAATMEVADAGADEDVAEVGRAGDAMADASTTDAAVDASDTSADMGRDAALDPRRPGVFVAVGDGFERVASQDGVEWYGRTFEGADIPGDTDVIRDVAFGDGRVLCVNNNHRVFISDDDGETWTEVRGMVDGDPSVGPGWFGGLVFAEGEWWGAGGNGQIRRSADGVDWTTARRGGRHFRAFAYGGGRWLAAGDGNFVARSGDGVEWELAGGETGGGYQGAAYGMGMFVTVGHGMHISIHRDGEPLSVERVTVPGLSDREGSLRDITYLDGKFYVVGNQVTATFDGEVWEVASYPGQMMGVAAGVTPDGETLIVGVGGWEVVSSSNGLEWERAYGGGYRLRSVRFWPLP